MDNVLVSPGAWVDVLGGGAQVVVSVYLVRLRRGAAALSFAAFVALNGLAFLFGNLVARSHPLFPILRLTTWGTLNWMALVAVLVTAASLATRLRRQHTAFAVACIVAGTLALLSWASTPPSVTTIAFGGSAVYAAVAALLVVCLFLAFRGGSIVWDAPLLVAMTAINSGLHAGVALSARANAYAAAHAALLVVMAGLWLRSPADVVARLVAAGSLLIPLIFGFASISILGSQAAVQDSGLYGIGRILSASIGVIALQRGFLFREPRSAAAAPSAFY